MVTEPKQEKSFGYKWFTKEDLDDPQYGIGSDILFYAKAALEEVI